MDPRHAALVVCGHAHDTGDAVLLLEHLGLLDGGRLCWPRAHIEAVRNIKQIASPGAGNRRAYQ